MPEGSSTHQGHKRPMSREHLLSTTYHHRIGRYSRSVTQAKICPRFSLRMSDKPDGTADANITPSFAIRARVARLASWRPNNSNLAFFFLAWPRKINFFLASFYFQELFLISRVILN